MKLEGILIQKTPYRDKDLIAHILTRRGLKLGLYFYGGQGGKKGSQLELGHMIKVILPRDKRQSELRIAKFEEAIWSAKYIRENYRAFLLSQFFLEVLGKIALEDDLDDRPSDQAGLFTVLSNALYVLDQACHSGRFDLFVHLQLFLTKLIIHLGIIPHLEQCLYCDLVFEEQDLCLLDRQNGGFVCVDCASKRDEFLSDNRQLREEYQTGKNQRLIFKTFGRVSYKSYESLPEISRGIAVVSFNYFNYQYGFTEADFKTWKLLFD